MRLRTTVVCLLLGITHSQQPFAQTPAGWFTQLNVPSPAAPFGLADLASGDLNGDGWPDLVLGVFGGPQSGNRIWLNIDAGVFADSGQVLGDSPTASLALIDLDLDGDLDLVAGNGRLPSAAAPSADVIWINNGAGQFTPSAQVLPASETSTVDHGDIDADGDPDLIFGRADGTVEIWVSTAGVVSLGQVLSPADIRPVLDLVSDDFNADGLADVAFIQARQVHVWLSSPAGLSLSSAFPAPSASSLAAGDLDGDQLADLVVANLQRPSQWWFNQGQGVFQLPQANFSNALDISVTVADFDNQPGQDVLLVGSSNIPFFAFNEGPVGNVWRNRGDGLDFIHRTQCFADTEGETRGVTVADFDNDGDLDAAIYSRVDLGSAVELFFNGGETFLDICCPAQFAHRQTSNAPPPTPKLTALTPEPINPGALRRFRDEVMAARTLGPALATDYQQLGQDLLAVLSSQPQVLVSISEMLAAWQPNVDALLLGSADRVMVTSSQVQLADQVMSLLAMHGSQALADYVTAQRLRLPPFGDLAGLSVNQFSDRVLGPAPLIFSNGFEGQ